MDYFLLSKGLDAVMGFLSCNLLSVSRIKICPSSAVINLLKTSQITVGIQFLFENNLEGRRGSP